MRPIFTRCFRLFLTTILFAVLAFPVFGTTWQTAFPYTQKMSGQDIVIRAFPFAPFSGSPMYGKTSVYLRNKLLYSIDNYYREKVLASDDGQYLAIIHTSNLVGVSSYSVYGMEQVDFNQKAIEVFRNGKPFKTFTLKDVIDTTSLLHNGRFFQWGYSIDLGAFRDAEFGCTTCKEIYGEKVLRNIDTSEIDIEDWEECKRKCDSTKLKNKALHLVKNSIYVQNNSLFILTNLQSVVKLGFSNMTIERLPFAKIVSEKSVFNPPRLKVKEKHVNYPNKFILLRLRNGKTFANGVAAFLNKQAFGGRRDSATIEIYIHTLLINNYGKCELVYTSPYIREQSGSREYKDDSELKIKLEEWIKNQTFDTTLLPKDFEKFNFTDFIYLR